MTAVNEAALKALGAKGVAGRIDRSGLEGLGLRGVVATGANTLQLIVGPGALELAAGPPTTNGGRPRP